jgi:hypothetical protein
VFVGWSQKNPTNESYIVDLGKEDFQIRFVLQNTETKVRATTLIFDTIDRQ